MKRDRTRGRVTRRGFIKNSTALGASAAVAPLVLKLTACSDSGDGSDDTQPVDATGADQPGAEPGGDNAGAAGDGADPGQPGDNDTGGDDNGAALAAGSVLIGLHAGDGEAAMAAAADSLDFSWLGDGDSVLIKVACNSGNPHPATTSPGGVRAMVAALKARGAGRVIVADQAGVEWVRLTASGRHSSTRERFEQNGLVALESDAELHFFDDGDWESGYFEATLPEGSRWPRGMRVASIAGEVDHIIYMPRISAHILAGVTNAQKSAIGWLRDDSRHDLHRDAVDFYEKYAEINYVEEIRSRFRMVVTVNEAVQLFGGPDEGTAFQMDPPLVLASSSLANHDAVATSILVTLQNTSGATSSGMAYNPGFASIANGFFAGGTGVGGTSGPAGTWTSAAPNSSYQVHNFAESVDGERAVVRGWELSGGKPSSIEVVLKGDEIDADLKNGIESHGGGLYSIG
ncbi:MAG: DUF362 domain-containing protein [Myxococcales bacterium]|nr:DUF362 domain-containing protein [Myxococcales bacterium]